MFPMNRRVIRSNPVVVEYDCRGKRVRKTLDNSLLARRFFQQKDKAGKHPTIINPERKNSE